MKKLFLFFTALCLLCCKCRKDEPIPPAQPTLPPATQTGANTFGCLVNGKVWLPRGAGLLPSISSDYNKPVLIITTNQAQANETIKINLTTIYSTGNFVLNDTLIGQNIFYFKNNTWYNCDSIISGKLYMTMIDTIARIISGTFYFDAVNANTRYELRDGRFDLKY